MSFEARLEAVRSRITAACASVGRDPASVTLIAVGKNHPVEAILRGYDLGLRHFGESRLQEAIPKMESLPSDIVWHFVGKLQSNKARRVAERFSAIHSLESDAQLREISKSASIVDGLIEVNLAKEEQKSGIFTGELDLLYKAVLNCPHVRFQGLMTIGPFTTDPETARPHFANLCQLNERLGGKWLSMGMSDDFDVAIQEGATHIRVGTALFGSRK